MSTQGLLERRHQSDTRSPEWKTAAVVGRVTVSHIQRFQLGQGLLENGTCRLGPAIQGVVVKEHKMMIPSESCVDFHNLSTRSKGCLDRRQCIVDVAVRRHGNATSRACGVIHVGALIRLVYTSLGHKRCV